MWKCDWLNPSVGCQLEDTDAGWREHKKSLVESMAKLDQRPLPICFELRQYRLPAAFDADVQTVVQQAVAVDCDWDWGKGGGRGKVAGAWNLIGRQGDAIDK